MRDHSEHGVAIREQRDNVLTAVRKDYGVRFAYWKLPMGEVPSGAMDGMAYIVADDELLPESQGKKVYVPLNSNVSDYAVGMTPSGLDPAKDMPLSEKQGEGKASLPTVFV